MLFNLKSHAAAAAMIALLPFAAQAGDTIEVAGVWSFDKDQTEIALKEKGVSAEEFGMAALVLAESAVVFDEEDDVISFLLDAETIAGVCSYTEVGDGTLSLTECFDGEEKEADPMEFGTVTIYDDGTLSTEDETYIAWYKKAE